MAYDLKQITNELEGQVSTLNQQSIADWLPKFQSIYRTGMSTGISAAFLRYLAEATGMKMEELPTQVPNFAKISKERTEQVFNKLSEKLGDQDSQDYAIMNARLTSLIAVAKDVDTWEEAQTAKTSNLNLDALLHVYFYGFQYGFQISFWAGMVEYDFAYQGRQITQKEGAELAQSAAVAETNEQMQFALEHDDILAQTYFYILNSLK